jgi:penicillin-binding protein 1A
MSHRDRQRRRRHAQAGPTRFIFLGMGVFAAMIVIGILSVVGYVVSIANSGPSLAELKPVDQGENSVVYASDGKTRLGVIQANTLRTPIDASAIPQSARDATVAIEDKRFYRHKGVDFEGVIRAAVKNITSGHTIQGGSTLTMQLIRNLYTGDRTRDFKRKIREAKLAEELENLHPGLRGKRWILDKYLNNVPYGTVGGQTAVGLQAAARVFFNKPAKDLTVGESALLAGLPQAPSLYNPFIDSERATARRNDVLAAMADAGYISQETAATEEAAPLGVRHSSYYTKRRESYFFDYVRQQLVKQFGLDRVRAGGLRVYTTVDLKFQQLARKAIADRLANPGDPSAALVSIDPKTGYIKAMASSGDYGASKFNLAAQGHRQPGSTFKVMVLMTGLRRGVDPKATSYISHRLNFIDKATGAKIDVQTDDNRYRGRETLFEGLVHSDNTVYQQFDLDLGPEEVKQTAYDMGITSHLDGYPAEGLGGLRIGVSPLEMTRAYMTINTGGWRVRPVAITKVVFPDGKVDTSIGKLRRTKVFTDGETNEAIQAMEANVQRGTGTKAQIGCPAAGKTGTTSHFTDAWFDGFTPGLNTTVWVGYPNTTASMTNVPPYGEMFGGQAPALIWHDFMATAIGKACEQFPKPRQPFEPVPFFGKFSKTGAPSDTTTTDTTPTGPGLPAPGTGGIAPGTGDVPSTGKGNGKGKGNGNGNGNNAFPPDTYQSPPQTAPGGGIAPPSG